MIVWKLMAIEEEVCVSMDVSYKEIHSRSRLERVARARQVVYYLASCLTHITQESIGQWLGRNHSSVSIGRQRIKDLMSVDKPFAEMVEQIRLRAEARLQEKSKA